MNRTEPTVRAAAAADAPALAAVQIATWRCAYPGIVPDEYLAGMSPAEYTARWDRFLALPASRTLVIDVAGRIRAYCSFGPTRDGDLDPARIGEIHAIYVHPEDWRSGFGRTLLGAALPRLCAAGFVAVTLWVAEPNARARQFYRALAFADDGGRKIEVAGAPIQHLRYRWAPPAGAPCSNGDS
jgi:ribosomal protein S18 acetylase RimI-like enzyme